MLIHFYKYQGTGNDFVLVDNRKNEFSKISKNTIEKICDRRFGIGADGFMLLNAHEQYDFEMKYYNADGAEGSMCGNGGRSIVQFAFDLGVIKNQCKFIAVDGEHDATINSNGTISLKMTDVHQVTPYQNAFVLNTGSPHYVEAVDKIADLNVFEEGQAIRYNDDFKEKGINVNFVEKMNHHSIKVRTYERGVEDETYSCGTGVTASAMVFYDKEEGENHINIDTLGGKLSVQYNRSKDGQYSNVWLSGPASKVFEGEYKI